jgi:hypothetical protein
MVDGLCYHEWLDLDEGERRSLSMKLVVNVAILDEKLGQLQHDMLLRRFV